MKRSACYSNAFTFAYSFREVFKPDFDDGINVDSVKRFVQNKDQHDALEKHMALTSMPYNKKMLSDERFLEAVRAGESGC